MAGGGGDDFDHENRLPTGRRNGTQGRHDSGAASQCVCCLGRLPPRGFLCQPVPPFRLRATRWHSEPCYEGMVAGGDHPAGHNLLHFRQMASERDRLGSTEEVYRGGKGGRNVLTDEVAVAGSDGVFLTGAHLDAPTLH